MTSLAYLSIAAFGGILPALFWLWFWLHEDNIHPEPRKRLLFCFVMGMLSVPLVFPFQKIVNDYFGSDTTLTIILWATIEEIFKFAVAFFFALRLRVNDEPIDAIIYLITAALGFSALENTFFLFSSLQDGLSASVFLTGNLRFIGASLLHTASSAIVGISIAFAYWKPSSIKRFYTILGLIGAIALHTLFNLSIINAEGSNTIVAFYAVWITIVIILLMFEKVKHINNHLLT